MIQDQSRIFIDPNSFTDNNLPIIVLCDNLQGFLGWVIKAHTTGNYNHAMMMINPGMVVTQTNVLKEIPIDVYMVKNMMLKFWKVKDLTGDEKSILYLAVNANLRQPWWFRAYDIVGLLGQALWMPFIQLPWLKYCSESIAVWFRGIDRFKSILPSEPSPSDLDRIFKDNPNTFECLGYWWDS